MFNPRDELPSLELCKKLKELGYPQKGGGWYWASRYICGDETPHDCMLGECRKEPKLIWVLEFQERYNTENIKAPTVPEMWKWLPRCIRKNKETYFLQVSDRAISYYDSEYKDVLNFVYDNNLADRIAKMLIWLRQTGYIDFKKGKI